MYTPRRSSFVRSGCLAGLCAGLSVGLLGVSTSWAADKTIVLTGDVPPTRELHFFLPFEVPDGYKELEMKGDDLSPDNVLDFGLYNPWSGPEGVRGWGGGSGEPAILNEKAASRGYVPAPIIPGTWRVVVGKALIRATPARYRVEITLREKPTLAPQTERTPYVPAAVLRQEARYYAGDFHVHSRESTDARPNLDEIATFAKSRGLDFVVITDHNTVTQDDYIVAAQRRHPDLLLIPGIEVTTYDGHMNAIGATRFVEHKLDQPGQSLERTVQSIHDQGALFSINHPLLDLGDACIGCAFRHSLDKLDLAVDAFEVATGGLDQGGLLFSARTLKMWDELNNSGRFRLSAIGGSDDHQAGKGLGRTQSPIGDPTTLVLADELSAAGILRGVAKGRTVVKLQGPDDPMLEFTARYDLPTSYLSDTPPRSIEDFSKPGDYLQYEKLIEFKARVTGSSKLPSGTSVSVRFLKNGVPLQELPVTVDPFVMPYVLERPRNDGVETIRAEVLIDGVVHTVTTPMFIDHFHIQPVPPDTGCSAGVPRNRAVSATQLYAGLAILGGAYILARLRYRRRRAGAPN